MSGPDRRNPEHVTLPGGGSVTAVYDLVGRLRSQTHRFGGYTGVATFTYDALGRARTATWDDGDGRLSWAELDARPRVEETGASWTPRTDAVTGAWQAGEYARDYHYDTLGEDRVEAVSTAVWPGEQAPWVASTQSSPDGLGAIQVVDGFLRTRDALGNITSTPTESGASTLEYDGQSRLRRVVRADGAEIQYTYRSDGPLVSRVVTCPPGAVGCVTSARTYVYDGLLLLEEYEVQGAARRLVARYFYADEGDIPVSADLWDPNTNALERRYFVLDRVGTVLGVLDANGAWLETVDYDPWGRPTVTPADTQSPELRAVEGTPTGGLALVFSEPVLPPPDDGSADATGLLTRLQALHGVLVTDDVGLEVDGQFQLANAYGDLARGTVLQFVPNQPILAGTRLTATVAPGALIDRRGNGTAAQTISSLTYGPGILYASASQGPTAPQPVERSVVGNGLLFQSHLYDYDADLYLARARTYDPHTGTFLQLDPSGYADGVNLYALGANNAVNVRDPTGAYSVARFLFSKSGQIVGAYVNFEHSGRLVRFDSPVDPGSLGAAAVSASADELSQNKACSVCNGSWRNFVNGLRARNALFAAEGDANNRYEVQRARQRGGDVAAAARATKSMWGRMVESAFAFVPRMR